MKQLIWLRLAQLPPNEPMAQPQSRLELLWPWPQWQHQLVQRRLPRLAQIGHRLARLREEQPQAARLQPQWARPRPRPTQPQLLLTRLQMAARLPPPQW